MNRRGFLASLGTAAIAAAIDPDRLLWEPGKKVTFDLGATPPMDEWFTHGLKGTFSGYLKAGDVVTVAGVFEINPYTGQLTRQQKLFVVAHDAPPRHPVTLFPTVDSRSAMPGTYPVKPFGVWS